ncbi:hypothetical protein ACGK9R_10545 [Halomonas sp. HNIBRBA4712]|uniref:hypothetical protein n=1 Tax=Halomonas sp. HNIBRBA4712 TaxID=3373087 RepID=UPI00374762E8
MAVHIILPLLSLAGRSLLQLMRRWPNVLAVTGLIVASGFTIMGMMRQAGETALSLWPLLALASFFFLAKEFIRAWLKVRNKEIKNRIKK